MNLDESNPEFADDGAGQRPGRSAAARPPAVRPEVADAAGLDWAAAPAAPAASLGAAAVWHGFRRRWLLATTTGLVCAAAAAAVAWFALEPKFASYALLRVASVEPRVLETNDKRSGDFELYKRTQKELLRGRFVLNAALRDPAVAKLRVVQLEPDPVGWLEREIQVDFPSDTEIMRVSMRGDDAQAVAALVNAVVQTYLDEVVEKEKEQRRNRLLGLEQVYRETGEKIRNKRGELRQLADLLGTGDSQALTLKQQIALEQYAAVRKEHLTLEFELMRVGILLDAAKRRLASVGGPASQVQTAPAEAAAAAGIEPDALPVGQPVAAAGTSESQPPPAESPAGVPPPASPLSPYELERLVNQAPNVVAQRSRIAELEEKLVHAQRVATAATAGRVDAYRRDIDKARQTLGELETKVRETLIPELAHLSRAQLEAEVANLNQQFFILVEQEKHVRASAEKLAEAAGNIGRSSVELEMMRTEINQLDEIADQLGRQIETLRIELDSPTRITRWQSAEVPRFKDSKSQLQSTCTLALLAFLAPLLGIAWLDARSRRVNSSAEINHLLGMRVLGSLPMLPDRSRRLLSRAQAGGSQWRLALRESIDGIRTMLLRETDIEPTRVVLVTSAVSGEGKTSLATQLAVSFARAHCKTLLVDFDLRRPAAHRVFNLPLGPGISELLRGEFDLEELVQPTPTANLCMLTAGLCDERSLSALAQPVVGQCFDDLRERFDFILVDCSPILPVVDALLVGRHVDAALLSVLRDVSQAPKIQAAHDRLTALGIRVLGTVVTGKDEVDHRPDYRYQVQH